MPSSLCWGTWGECLNSRLDKYAYSACKLNETAVQQQYTKIDSFQLARLRDKKDATGTSNKSGGL